MSLDDFREQSRGGLFGGVTAKLVRADGSAEVYRCLLCNDSRALYWFEGGVLTKFEDGATARAAGHAVGLDDTSARRARPAWTTAALASNSEVPAAEWRQARAQCRREALAVPIPSPACTQHTPEDCSQYSTGRSKVGAIAQGLCQSRNNSASADCDYTAVDEARAAQAGVFESCLEADGWEQQAAGWDKPQP